MFRKFDVSVIPLSGKTRAARCLLSVLEVSRSNPCENKACNDTIYALAARDSRGITERQRSSYNKRPRGARRAQKASPSKSRSVFMRLNIAKGFKTWRS